MSHCLKEILSRLQKKSIIIVQEKYAFPLIANTADFSSKKPEGGFLLEEKTNELF